MKAKTFDQKFNRGGSVLANLDLTKAQVGVPRQSLIKLWLADRLSDSQAAKVF